LLLAPNFLTETDPRASADVPLWRKDNWMQGETSEFGHIGVTSFQALDDIVGYLADRKRFPAMKEIVLIGHSAGAQLMQRYAVFNNEDALLKQAGINIRYVISSPSSYVYFDASRPQDQTFAPVLTVMCPSYNKYRYGIEQPPMYLQSQNLSARQLFQRYAARDVTYIVGAQDNDPNHRVLDKSCGAQMQGESRVVRQHNYLQYEQFLAQKWAVAVHHPQFEVAGVAHSAKGIYSSELTAERLFPEH
jgi:pimeloyl-ACP methyl ester carboxylesterase